jgi:hypothetical protein
VLTLDHRFNLHTLEAAAAGAQIELATTWPSVLQQWVSRSIISADLVAQRRADLDAFIALDVKNIEMAGEKITAAVQLRLEALADELKQNRLHLSTALNSQHERMLTVPQHAEALRIKAATVAGRPTEQVLEILGEYADFLCEADSHKVPASFAMASGVQIKSRPLEIPCVSPRVVGAGIDIELVMEQIAQLTLTLPMEGSENVENSLISNSSSEDDSDFEAEDF